MSLLPPPATRQLIIIDSQVNNYQNLISNATGSDLLMLDASSDGLTQISDYLKDLPAKNFQSIHIISHGNAGSLLLGSSTVTGGNLNSYSSQLAAMGRALTDTGDILLYGCNVAADQTGLQFVNQFAELTGADVAASDDITGGQGNAQLEVVTGAVEATSIINAATLDSYNDNLAIPVLNVTAGITPVEGKTAGTFTISLDSPAPAGGLTVNYSLAGTAALSSDYTIAAGSNVTAVTGSSFIVAEGQSLATLVVNAVGDGVVDGGETINLNLTSGSGYQLANGSGVTFAPKIDYLTAGPGTNAVKFGDFNGDGKLDLIAACGNSFAVGNNTVSVLLRNAANTDFEAKIDYTSGSGATYDGARDVTTGDFNGDGKLDFAVANSYRNTASVFLRNSANTGFEDKTDYATGSYAAFINAGDFNNDGKLDLVVTNYVGNTVSVLLRNAANTGFDAKVDYATGTTPVGVSVGDFNNDGKLDLATANGNSDTVSVLLRNASNTGFDDRIDYIVGSNPSSVSTGDFNNDGKLDLAVVNHNGSIANNPTGNTISVLLRNAANNGFDSRIDYTVGSLPSWVSVGDFNNDGKADLAVTSETDGIVSVLLRNAANTGFDAKTDYVPGSTPQSLSLGDFNNDGKLDLATANIRANTVSVLLNNYTPTSATLSLTDTPPNNPPTLSSTTPTTFTEQTPVTLSNTLTLNDPDGDTDWNNGTLKLQITANNTANDSLILPTTNTGSIWLNPTNNVLMSNNTAIGNADAATASNGSVWTITFNAAATNALVQDTARTIQFTSSSDAPGTTARTVTFTATDKNGGSASATQTISITAVNDAPTGTVSITGTAQQGETLTAANTLADSDGLGPITYHWQANGADLGIGNTYLLTQAEIGKTITATAQYTDLAGTTESVSSAATAVVTELPVVATPGITITGTDLITNEQGDSAQFSVKLNAAPLRDVLLNFTSSDTTEGMINNPTLIFTAANWSTPQTLTITGQNDNLVGDGDVAYSVNAKISTLDIFYKSVTATSLNLTNQDTPIVKVETMTGTNGMDVIQGTSAPSYILGEAAEDDLSGGAGNDTIYGSYGADLLFGEDDNDALYGEQDADYLNGGAGNDILDGGLGLDTLIGGAGNDTYYLGYDALDKINDQGLPTDIDTVIMPYQLSQYTLPNGIEQGTIAQGTGASNLTGNIRNNMLTGNDGANALYGAKGRDSLYGGSADDILIGD